MPATDQPTYTLQDISDAIVQKHPEVWPFDASVGAEYLMHVLIMRVGRENVITSGSVERYTAEAAQFVIDSFIPETGE